MRKTSTYANKRRQQLANTGRITFNGAEWANTIQLCRPYSSECVVPGWEVGATQGAADAAAIRVLTAFQHIRDGLAVDYTEHDVLAHAIGVSLLRAYDIAGDDPATNHMLPYLLKATDALRRLGERYQRTGRWGFDGPALQEVKDGIDVYEEILMKSSPAEMTAATKARQAIIDEQRWAA